MSFAFLLKVKPYSLSKINKIVRSFLIRALECTNSPTAILKCVFHLNNEITNHSNLEFRNITYSGVILDCFKFRRDMIIVVKI
jgi:hypothetical protein